jgi:prepilin-type N-terminal cleavage/methylation domain-containing protein
MLKKLFLLYDRQQGFTLIELLIAIAILAVIGTVLATTVTQLFVVQAADKNHMEAVKQVENALHYINRDAQMAWPSKITEDNGTSYPRQFPLKLFWIDYTDNGTVHTVEYQLVTIDGIVNLQRIETVKGVDSTLNVAKYIDTDPTKSYVSFDNQVLTINLTASVNGLKSATETRSLQVQLRTTQ